VIWAGPNDASSGGVRDDGRVARRRGWYVVPFLAAVLGLSGCGTASEPSPPSGVDELAIPTPSVDPDDFVARIDNPWLPLASGATWTYRVTGSTTGVSSGTQTVTVRDQAEDVAGVSATAVDTSGPAGDVTDYYAQDRSGNVWWLGREGVWRAGDDGAEAGLAMPRHPRVGDGWRTALLSGVVEDRASVAALDGSVSVPAGTFDNLVELETSSPLTPELGTLESYARGVGLVRTVSTSGPTYRAELVSGP